MLTTIDGSILAAAFPTKHHLVAMSAGSEAASLLAPRQWTNQFTVYVEHEPVLIPARLHFASDRLRLANSDEAWRFVRALQTRSGDGFERQRAARDLLAGLEPWAAPFIISLIGEYVVQILEDVSAAMTPELEHALGTFIVHNEAFWNTTKRRITSYWNAYYRCDCGSKFARVYPRKEYVGFKLIAQLEAAASTCTKLIALSSPVPACR